MTFDELQMNLDLLRGKDDLTVGDIAALFKDILDGVSRAYPGGIDALEIGENVKDAAKNLSAAAHGLLSMFSKNKPKIIGSTKIQTIVEDRIVTFESLHDAESFLDELSEKVVSAQMKKDELKRMVGQLETIEEEYQSAIERYNILKKSVENKKKDFSEAEGTIKTLEEENSDLDNQLSEIEKKKKELDSENTEKKNEFEQLDKDYKSAVREKESLLKQKEHLEDELVPLKTTLEKLSDEHERLCKEKKSTEEEIVKLKSVLIPQEVTAVEEGKRKLEELKKDLEKSSDEKVRLDKEIAANKSEIAAEEKKCAELRVMLEDLEVQLGSKENDSGILQENVNKYKEQLEELNDPSARSKAERLRRSCKTISDVVEKLFSVNSSIRFGNISDKTLSEKQQQMNNDLLEAEHILEKLCDEYNRLREAVED